MISQCGNPPPSKSRSHVNYRKDETNINSLENFIELEIKTWKIAWNWNDIFKPDNYHCTENRIFFFQTSWKDDLSKKIALEYDLACSIKKDDISFFPKIWSYTLKEINEWKNEWNKWKMIFLKKIHGNTIFFSKSRAGTWYFLYYLERWNFSTENIFFPWGERERLPFSGNT